MDQKIVRANWELELNWRTKSKEVVAEKEETKRRRLTGDFKFEKKGVVGKRSGRKKAWRQRKRTAMRGWNGKGMENEEAALEIRMEFDRVCTLCIYSLSRLLFFSKCRRYSAQR